jgi:hypothetical protein
MAGRVIVVFLTCTVTASQQAFWMADIRFHMTGGPKTRHISPISLHDEISAYSHDLACTMGLKEPIYIPWCHGTIIQRTTKYP